MDSSDGETNTVSDLYRLTPQLAQVTSWDQRLQNWTGGTPSPRLTRFHVAWNSASARNSTMYVLCGIPLEFHYSPTNAIFA